MRNFREWAKSAAGVAAILSIGALPAAAETFVYVSNAADGDISAYEMTPTGQLEPIARIKAAEIVMPMTVNADKTILYAAARSEPYTIFSYTIDPATGSLSPLDQSPLAESFPYISIDNTGRFLLAASYGGHLVSVNAIAADGKVSEEPLQVIPTGRNAHAIRVDRTNRFVFVPSLGDDQIMQFDFDEETGRLTSNTPAAVKVEEGLGPRHIAISDDNKFVYVVSEFYGKVLVFSLDGETGLLTQIGEADGMPADTELSPGKRRLPVAAGTTAPPVDTSKDIWAADIHLTPDGRFLYISERNSSSLAGFSVDRETGLLTYLGSTSTETEPRGFAIDRTGEFLVASGQKSDHVAVYTIDDQGALEPVGRYPGGDGANWVEIVTFD